MCIDFYGHHSDGSSFVYVNDFVITETVFIPTGTSSALKKKIGEESHYRVSRPKLGSNPPFGSDRTTQVQSSCLH